MNKKGVEFRYLIIIVVGVVTLIISIVIVQNLLGKGARETASFLKDWDGDGTTDALDRCKCEGADTDDGCPSTYTDKDKENSDCKCPKELRPERCPD